MLLMVLGLAMNRLGPGVPTIVVRYEETFHIGSLYPAYLAFAASFKLRGTSPVLASASNISPYVPLDVRRTRLLPLIVDVCPTQCATRGDKTTVTTTRQQVLKIGK